MWILYIDVRFWIECQTFSLAEKEIKMSHAKYNVTTSFMFHIRLAYVLSVYLQFGLRAFDFKCVKIRVENYEGSSSFLHEKSKPKMEEQLFLIFTFDIFKILKMVMAKLKNFSGSLSSDWIRWPRSRPVQGKGEE